MMYVRGLVEQASGRSSSLAWLLAGYDHTVLRARLDCSDQTALWLQLFGRPRYRSWRQDVRHIANDLGIDATSLAQLVWEAEIAASHAAEQCVARVPAPMIRSSTKEVS